MKRTCAGHISPGHTLEKLTHERSGSLEPSFASPGTVSALIQFFISTSHPHNRYHPFLPISIQALSGLKKKKKYFTSGKLEDTQTKSTKFPQGSVQVRVLSSSGPTVLTYSLPLILVRIPRKNTEHILPTFDAPFPSWSFSRTAQHISYSAQPLFNKWPLNKPSSQISQDRNKTRLRHCSDSMIVKSSGWLASPRYPLLYC